MGVICEQVQDVAELGEAADDDARRNQLRFRDLIRVGFKTFSKLRITLTGQMHIHKHIMILVCRRAVIGRRCDSRKRLRRGRSRRRRRRRYLGYGGHGGDDDYPDDSSSLICWGVKTCLYAWSPLSKKSHWRASL